MKVSKLLAFGGAAGRIVFGVEVEDEVLAFGAGEAERVPASSGKFEVRRRFV
jgi:hypothetical protein